MEDSPRRKKRRRRRRERKEQEDVAAHVGGCMKSDVEKQEQESDAFARGKEGGREERREREREEREREPSMYPVFEPKVLRAS